MSISVGRLVGDCGGRGCCVMDVAFGMVDDEDDGKADLVKSFDVY